MSGLPLQPELRPPERRWLGWSMVGALALAVLLLGWWQGARRRPAQVLVSSTDAGESYIATVQRLIRGAERRVWVAVYVLRPDDGPVKALCDELAAAHRRGVDVVVCLDKDRQWGGEGLDPKHEHAAAFLAERGVPVLVDDLSRRLHAKLVVVDDVAAVVGSHNWTGAALERNREVSVAEYDPQVVAEVAALFADLPGWDARDGAAAYSSSR